MENREVIKIRKNWGPISPITRIKDSDKHYNRKAEKERQRREAVRDYYIHNA